ncbi:hypothetical protein F5884DRAFT_779363 [Xylogone sp. PMI_703]|nr:hypothetical protein F5884DRAFT_779363 [Xylogone sp. PMI_703]
MLIIESYALEFILSIYEYITDKCKEPRDYLSCQEYCSCKTESTCQACSGIKKSIESLRERISTTCQGHIRWLCETAEPSEDGEFAAYYWPTGEVSKDHSGASLIDTPLQLLQVYDCIQVGISHNEEISPGLKNKIKSWISVLDKVNWHGRYVFPRKDFEEENKYRLADHVLICQAIQAAEYLGYKSVLTPSTPSIEENYALQQDRFINEYSFSETRRIVNKRFVCENSFSGQRMLATRRTSSKTRFLFHSKDTVLFHAMERGFFLRDDWEKKYEGKLKKENMKMNITQVSDKRWNYTLDVWKNTVEGQSDHIEYQDMDWTKPLWYALAMIISSQERRINKLSPNNAFDRSSETLFRMSSPNGLFPGFLDRNQEPLSLQYEQRAENYWHPTFELPFILWKYAKNQLEARSDVKDINNTTTSATKDSGSIGQLVSKTLPFANFNVIDQQVLVEISDDWLQEEPSTLKFGFRPDLVWLKTKPLGLNDSRGGSFQRYQLADDDNIRSVLSRLRGSVLDGLLKDISLSADNEESGTVTEAPPADSEKKENFIDIPSADNVKRGIVIDIPKRSSGDEIQRKLTTNSDIKSALEITRTVQYAKKRLIWLPNGDKLTAFFCYLASPGLEKENLLAFFDRHANYEKYFFDSTAAALNEWETELHLSFFRIHDGETGASDGIPEPSSITLRKLQTVSMPTRAISQVVKSFRIAGDFYDRYWTCHFLENGCGRSYDNLESRLHKLTYIKRYNTPSDKRSFERPWQQRKILELLLFNEILEEMYECTNKIWDWARESVLQNPKAPDGGVKLNFTIPGLVEAESDTLNTLVGSLSNGVQFLNQGNNDNYFSITKRWRFFEQLLQALEEDLSRNLERIREWNNREDDRKPERPRWTKNDEKAFRPAITKLLVLNDRKVRELGRLRSSIKIFQDSLDARLSSIRDDMGFRSAQNMATFTYVTVVFLPLGFATGIFSMSEAPGKTTLASMVITAVIALSITVVTLVNAKHLWARCGAVLRFVFRLEFLSKEEKLKYMRDTHKENAGNGGATPKPTVSQPSAEPRTHLSADNTTPRQLEDAATERS